MPYTIFCRFCGGYKHMKDVDPEERICPQCKPNEKLLLSELTQCMLSELGDKALDEKDYRRSICILTWRNCNKGCFTKQGQLECQRHKRASETMVKRKITVQNASK